MTDVTEDVALGELYATAPNATTAGFPAGLPMPRDPACSPTWAAGSGSAPSTATATRSRCPTAGSSWPRRRDLDPGEVRALHYFDRDLVLYRAADGTPHVMDAHCPHLGAHLAVAAGSRTTASAARSTAGASTAARATASRSPTAT